MLKKRMIFSNQIKDISFREMQIFALHFHSQNKVFRDVIKAAIIGMSLQSLLIADKLS